MRWTAAQQPQRASLADHHRGAGPTSACAPPHLSLARNDCSISRPPLLSRSLSARTSTTATTGGSSSYSSRVGDRALESPAPGPAQQQRSLTRKTRRMSGLAEPPPGRGVRLASSTAATGHEYSDGNSSTSSTDDPPATSAGWAGTVHFPSPTGGSMPFSTNSLEGGSTVRAPPSGAQQRQPLSRSHPPPAAGKLVRTGSLPFTAAPQQVAARDDAEQRHEAFSFAETQPHDAPASTQQQTRWWIDNDAEAAPPRPKGPPRRNTHASTAPADTLTSSRTPLPPPPPPAIPRRASAGGQFSRAANGPVSPLTSTSSSAAAQRWMLDVQMSSSSASSSMSRTGSRSRALAPLQPQSESTEERSALPRLPTTPTAPFVAADRTEPAPVSTQSSANTSPSSSRHAAQRRAFLTFDDDSEGASEHEETLASDDVPQPSARPQLAGNQRAPVLEPALAETLRARKLSDVSRGVAASASTSASRETPPLSTVLPDEHPFRDASSDKPPVTRREAPMTAPLERVLGATPFFSDFQLPPLGQPSDDDETAAEAPKGQRPRVSHASAPASVSGASEGDATLVLFVCGPRGCGKSTFVTRALRHSSESRSESRSSYKDVARAVFTVNGRARTVDVHEIESDAVLYTEQGLRWPADLPRPEGVLFCYDATDSRAASSLERMLRSFWLRGERGVPVLVLACKASSNDDLERAGGSRDAYSAVNASLLCNQYGAQMVVLDGGVADAQRKSRKALSFMLRSVLDARDTEQAQQRRRHAAGSPSMSMSPHTPRSLSPSSRRATGMQRSVSEQTSGSPGGSAIMHRSSSEQSSSPQIAESPAAMSTPSSPQQGRNALRKLGDPAIAGDAAVGEQLEPAPQETATRPGGELCVDMFFWREDLIDKLLYASVAGNDETFCSLFLVVFRRFARPFEVLKTLVDRFNYVSSRLKSDPLLSRYTHMRLTSMLSVWVQTYPGDFTSPTTFGLLRSFLENLIPSSYTWVSHYAAELLPILQLIPLMRDSHSSWALSDTPPQHNPRLSSVDLQAATRPASLNPSELFESDEAFSSSDHTPSFGFSVADRDIPDSATTQNFSARARPHRSASSSRSTTTVESADQSKGSSVGSRRTGESGVNLLLEASNAVLERDDDEVAIQITRIAWENFAGITPRDLLGHVLAPRDPKEPMKLLRDTDSKVVKSIDFVNHLAAWVTSLILVQSRAKVRVRAVKHFIAIASRLRERENFDGLMGVLAGLSAQPVFRLSETWKTVEMTLTREDNGRLWKRYQSLKRLMATTRSFSAYRLALSSSGTQMIPYLGVALQDITVVNEIKSDMRDGRVNWSKFQQMGQAASVVLNCSRVAPPLPLDGNLDYCIKGVALLDEDAQYNLSFELQPSGGAAAPSAALERARRMRRLISNVSEAFAASGDRSTTSATFL